MCCGGAHVGKAIQSVPDQTYANIELIMVDGASPDEHAAVVKLFSGSTKGPDRNKCATLGVEAPARQGARSAHVGNMPATSNAARRDASASKVAKLFRSGP